MALKIFDLGNKDFKSFTFLLSGNVLSKVIVALGTLFLARFYGPSQYGIFNVFLSYIALFPVLTSFNLENIIITTQGGIEIRKLFSVSLWVSTITALIIALVLLMLHYLNILKIENGYPFILICCIGGIITSWNNIQSSLFTKYKLFRQISLLLIISSVVTFTIQFLAYFFGFFESGLIYGWLVGLCFSFLYGKLIFRHKIMRFDFTLLKKKIAENLDILRFAYPSDALNVIANNLLPILTLAFFSAADVGVYTLALKLTTLPLVFLSSAVSKIYFQKSVKLNKSSPGQLYTFTCTIAKSCFIVVLTYIFLINSLGKYFLNTYYNDWTDLTKYILYLSPWIIGRSLVNPISTILFVIKKNYFALIFNTYLLFVNLVAIAVGIRYNNYSYCILFFSTFSCVGYLFLFSKIFLNLRANAK